MSRNESVVELEEVMKTSQGRNVLNDILTMTGVGSDVFDDCSATHAYQSGMNAVGVLLTAKLKEASPDLYLKMLKEKMDE